MFSTRIATQIYAKICFETTLGQKKIIEKLSEYLAGDDFSRIFVLNGYAGTGKTTLIAALVGALKDLNIKPILLAPTGRAAKVLAQYAQEKAFTIHKRIYRQRTNADYESKYSLNFNAEKGAVFIVDEASMLSDSPGGGALFGSGSQYVRSGRDCRLVLVGDSAQLPPVGADCSPALDAASLARFGDVEYATMDDVVRQEAESGILFNATLVRCMLENGIHEIPHFEMGFPDIEAVEGGEFLDKLQDCYARYGRDETIVITRSNKRANRFNEGIRKRLRRYEDFYGFRFADVVLEFPDYEDTEIECRILLDTIASESPALTREESSRLFYEVEKDYLDVKSKIKRFKEIRENPHFNALQVKFSYAVTCHKAQGGQWKAVFVDRCLFGDEPMTRDMLRWLYTALTRATDKLYLVNFDNKFYE